MYRLLFLFLLFISPKEMYSQFIDLHLTIVDEVSITPISDAHVFISNATYGTTSNENGEIHLSIPKGLKEDLIISHVSYDTKVVRYGKVLDLVKNDIVYLKPNGINLEEIVVVQKRSKSWKKNFKRFSESFLGDGKLASKCKILNPEVLRFTSNKKGFVATAIDMLKIQNDHLGYQVDFLLEYLVIDKNGSMKYIGHANFIDNAPPKKVKKIYKNRADVYVKSPKHFFEHLINNDLEKGKYKISLAKYENGFFEEVSQPKVDEILYYDSNSNHYLLTFSDFLQIKHLGFKVIDDFSLKVRQGGLESSRFNSSQHNSSTKITFPTSYLFKLTPNLIINQYGNVVNHKAVQEYGFWATQRMAHRLPLDYGIDYSSYKDFDADKLKQSDDSVTIVKDQKLHSSSEQSSLDITKTLLYSDKKTRDKTFDFIDSKWENKFLPPLLDLLRINQDPYMEKRMKAILANHIGAKSYYEGLQWLWENDPVYDKTYGNAKAEIYKHLDPKFKTYFEERQHSALIGLDEIIWGGVNQDGIPPLRYPEMINSVDATYLSDDDIVFGISIDGDHRAYPKRILAWHEFFVDDISDKKIAGVYCTLCGTMIAYDMNYNGKFYDLGTSGFLYNSNKLMYDKETQSLWSTIEGIPVLGPISDQGIRLESYSVITSTWSEWKKSHPATFVLSLKTGHNRNYDEGEAYKSYFATDELMFPVPQIDNALRNKDEVLVIRPPNYQNDPLAISIDYLKKKRIYQGQILNNQVVVLSEKDGWSRVYEASDIQFKSYKKSVLKDDKGNKWSVSESHITGPDNVKLKRVPSHNSFWFAFFNAFPNTRLVKL